MPTTTDDDEPEHCAYGHNWKTFPERGCLLCTFLAARDLAQGKASDAD